MDISKGCFGKNRKIKGNILMIQNLSPKSYFAASTAKTSPTSLNNMRSQRTNCLSRICRDMEISMNSFTGNFDLMQGSPRNLIALSESCLQQTPALLFTQSLTRQNTGSRAKSSLSGH